MVVTEAVRPAKKSLKEEQLVGGSKKTTMKGGRRRKACWERMVGWYRIREEGERGGVCVSNQAGRVGN